MHLLVSIYYNLGTYSVLVSIYAGEIGSPELRGVLGAVCQLSVILGKIDTDTAAGTACMWMSRSMLNLDPFDNLQIILISI